MLMCDPFELVLSLTQKFQKKNKDLDYLLFIEHILNILGDYANLQFSSWHEDLK